MKKKILILLVVLVPMFANAQVWFTAVSMAIDNFDGVKQEWEGWRDCNIRICVEKYSVKILGDGNEPGVFIGVEGGFKELPKDSDGNLIFSMDCVDVLGQKPVIDLIISPYSHKPSFMVISYENFLGREEKFAILYAIKFSNEREN